MPIQHHLAPTLMLYATHLQHAQWHCAPIKSHTNAHARSVQSPHNRAAAHKQSILLNVAQQAALELSHTPAQPSATQHTKPTADETLTPYPSAAHCRSPTIAQAKAVPVPADLAAAITHTYSASTSPNNKYSVHPRYA